MDRASQPQVVVAGHICVDIIPALGGACGPLAQALAPGSLVQVGPAAMATGGTVSNTGLALHKLGFPVRLVGKVGDDAFGRVLLDLCRAMGPRLAEGMIVVPGEITSYTIVLSPPAADRSFLHCPGANDTFCADDVDGSCLAGARLFHFGYPPVMRRMYEGDGRELAELLGKAKRSGATVSLDMARPDPASPGGRADWRAILRRALPEVDVFLPSLDEMLFMLDRSRLEALQARAGAANWLRGVDGGLLEEVSGRLLAMGPAVVGLKLGDQGLFLRTSADGARLASMGRCGPSDAAAWLGRALLAPCFQVEVAGTTGAGDATIAGFLAGLLEGMTPEQAVTHAVAVGACNVERADSLSGIRPWGDVKRRIAAGWPRRGTEIGLTGWRLDAEAGLWRSPHDGR